MTTKFEPVTVRVNEELATTIVLGEREATAGTGLRTVKVWPDAEVPPPGAGLRTVIVFGPTVVRSPDGTVALIDVVVGVPIVVSACPFHRTMEDPTKFEPVTVSVNAELFRTMELGEMALTTPGTGLLTVKFRPAEVEPPGAGLVTVIVDTLAVAKSMAGTVALIDIVLDVTVARA